MATDILDEHVELNIYNCNLDDVSRLNAWAIQAYDEIERLRASLPRWTPVGERLPVRACYVIGRRRGGQVMECAYMDGEFTRHGSHVNLTHWMPFPEPQGEG